MPENLVIIPTYNERENVTNIIEAVFALPHAYHILIVDDGSPDGTAAIVKQLQQTYPDRLHLKERKGKLGLGTAYIAGFRWGIEHDYQLIYEMDADFSHSPADLVRMRQAALNNEGDVIVGSRYIKGGKLENWPFDRIFLSKGASYYVRTITWMPVYDATAGFICYKQKVLKAIDFDKIKFVGYAFQIEMKYAAHQLGFKIKEIPITFKDRVEGVSKMSGSIIKEAILGVLQMRLRRVQGGYGWR